ncbi:succinic semialdehyde dehydrogenase [Aquipuribacter nitratireducens]|uniref:Succinic semialdehyde dehydrogenase n=1 Tax=Aquipuribacter nitratireducens TaxID=650104 RepID=A0ABW0GK08_9MICO
MTASTTSPVGSREDPTGLVAVPGATGEPADVVSPATQAVLVRVRRHVADDVGPVVAGAARAQVDWAAVPVAERAAVLRRVHDLVLRDRGALSDLVQDVTGKSRADAYLEVVNALQVTRHHVVRGPGYLRPQRRAGFVPGLTTAQVRLLPVGVVGNVAAWNYPLVFVLSDSVAPLLAGDAVVVKPALRSVPLALRVAALLREAGVPDGLWRVLAGDEPELVQALVEAVDHVLFTGSERVGREVGALAGRSLVGSTLELGGKNAAYVAADADVPAAATALVRDCFGSAGQTCTSTERLYVHADVAEAFTAAFLAATERLRVGWSRGLDVDMGSLVSPEHRARVLGAVDRAVAAGARVLTGGHARDDLGPAFMAPTVLADVPDDAAIGHEETFGPVVHLVVVPDDDAAATAMADHPSGLSAAVWTRDGARARRVAGRLRVGTVVVNETYQLAWGSPGAPVGGFGTSGYGRRYGPEGIAEVTRPQVVLRARGGVVPALMRRPAATWVPVLDGVLRAARRVGLR